MTFVVYGIFYDSFSLTLIYTYKLDKAKTISGIHVLYYDNLTWKYIL